MKKILIIITTLLLLTACTNDPVLKYINEPEGKYYGNTMQCYRYGEDRNERIWLFQDPETYEVYHGTLTVYESINIYDENGKKIDVDVNEMFCKDYDKDVFNDCIAVLTKSALTGEKTEATAKYTYIKETLNPEDGFDKDQLTVLKELSEKYDYECNLFID